MVKWLRLLLVLLPLVWAVPASAQAPGFAEITRPGAGEAVAGIVTIEGTANLPALDHFDLSFGYEPNSTDTWFPIVESDTARVVEGRLAVWDTSGVADGVYTLRLRVFPVEGEPLVAFARGIRVHNYTAAETPTPAPTSAAGPAPSEVTPSPTSPPPAPTATVAPRASDPTRAALTAGAGIAVVGLAIVAVYSRARAAARAAWGAPSRRASRSRAERRRKRRTVSP